MAIDLNADVGQIIKDFLAGKHKKKSSQASADSSADSVFSSKAKENYKNAVLKSVLIVCAAAIVIWLINQMTETPIKKDDSEFANTSQLKEAISQQELNIITTKNLYNSNKNQVSKILPEYSEMEGSKNLFNLVSQIAEKHTVPLNNIKKGVETPMMNPVKHTKTTIALQFNSSYPQYLNFKKELAAKKPILAVQSEQISLESDPYSQRSLNVTLILTDYSLDKDKYEKIIQ